MFTYANVLTAGRIMTDRLDDDKLIIKPKSSDITFIHRGVSVTIAEGEERPAKDIQITIRAVPDTTPPALCLTIVLEDVFNAHPEIVADIAISTVREVCKSNIDGNLIKTHNRRIKKLFSLVPGIIIQQREDLNFSCN